MKKLIYSALSILLFLPSLLAQVPESFTYQAVATDVTGDEVINTVIGIRISIVKGDMNGDKEWVETHAPATDDFGLFTISVGEGVFDSGTVSNFSDINWADDNRFLQIDMDPSGGVDYQFVGITQLLSVPYALASKRSDFADQASFADSSVVAMNAVQADSAGFATNAGNALNALNATNAQFASQADTAMYLSGNNDASNFNELQSLVIANDSLFLSPQNPNSNSVGISLDEINNDPDPTNELQYLAQQGDSIFLTTDSNLGSNGISLDMSDGDDDPNNEIQQLTYSGDTLSIEGGNSVVFSSVTTFSAPGATLQFPQGVDDAAYILVEDTITVPPGKVFYMVASEDEVLLPGIGNFFGEHLTSPTMPIFNQGTFIDNCRCIGFLKDFNPLIVPELIILAPNAQDFYQVPLDRVFIIKSGVNQTTPISLNDQIINFFNTNVNVLVIPPGVIIRNTGNDEIIMTGYLKDDN